MAQNTSENKYFLTKDISSRLEHALKRTKKCLNALSSAFVNEREENIKSSSSQCFIVENDED
jgi:hypothetical protein